MEVINDLVGINHLKIYQNDDWFKFSLESVLLPYFVTINLRSKSILDLCTGNAPVPLILSTRTKAKIIGVEIQKDVALLAQKSVQINHLEKQITILNEDIKNLKNYYCGDNFDVITVNPPYFKNSELSIKNIDEHKVIARHEVEISLEEIIKISCYLLKNGGYLAMVHRTERLMEVLKLMNKYHLVPKKMQFIYPKDNSSSNLFMIECMKDGKEGLKILKPLFIHNDDGTYKEEIVKLFNKGV